MVSAVVPVVVCHAGAGIEVNSVSGIHLVVGFYHAIVDSSHHGCHLEGRARFYFVGHGMVFSLGIYAGLYAGDVGNGLYLTGFHLHDNSCSRFGIDLFEFFGQGILGNVLYFNIDSGSNIHPDYRLLVDDFFPTAAYPLSGTGPRSSPQQRVVSQLYAVFAPFVRFAVDVADGARGQRPERFLALHHGPGVKSAFVGVHAQERICLDLFQVGVGDLDRGD